MTTEDASPRPSRLKIGAIGCVAAIGFALLALGGIVAVTFTSYERGLAGEAELDRSHGRYDTFRIPSDGTVAPDCMRRFIAVRRVLVPRCKQVSDLTDSFRQVPAAAAGGSADAGRLVIRIAGAFRRMPQMGVAFGTYVTARNDALLANRMGLGEYTWIYVVTYFGLLGQVPATLFESSNRPGLFQERIYPQVARFIERHIEDTAMTSGPWVEELARLRQDPGRVPFSGGLPRELAASVEPQRLALAAVACPAAAELDLAITVRRSVIGYDHR